MSIAKSNSFSDAAKVRAAFLHAYDENPITCSIGFPRTGWSVLQSGEEKEEVGVGIRFEGNYSETIRFNIIACRIASKYGGDSLFGGRQASALARVIFKTIEDWVSVNTTWHTPVDEFAGYVGRM